MRWRSTQVEFNVYILRLTDLDDELIEEQFTALEYRPNLINDDYEPFPGVFISHSRDALATNIAALVTQNGQRLRVWGLRL